MKTIALVGGPGSGKTKTLNYIRDNGLDLGLDNVITVSEIAENIIKLNPLLRRDPWELQTAIYYTQLGIDETLRSIYNELNTLLVFDRGLADSKVYLTDMFHAFAVNNSTSLEEMFSHYDAVYILESAVVAEQYQITDVRTEDKMRAAELNLRTIDVWTKHPMNYFIGATELPEDKIESVISIIKHTYTDWAR